MKSYFLLKKKLSICHLLNLHIACYVLIWYHTNLAVHKLAAHKVLAEVVHNLEVEADHNLEEADHSLEEEADHNLAEAVHSLAVHNLVGQVHYTGVPLK